LSFEYQKGLERFDYERITGYRKLSSARMEDITSSTGLHYLHNENSFVEFDREPLLPHMISTEGPALAAGDINHDGLQDVFIGSSKGKKNAIYIQTGNGTFSRQEQASLGLDSMYEDVDACIVDVNSDTHPDLIVASGGNEYYGTDKHL
jgi:hypothetical protein